MISKFSSFINESSKLKITKEDVKEAFSDFFDLVEVEEIDIHQSKGMVLIEIDYQINDYGDSYHTFMESTRSNVEILNSIDRFCSIWNMKLNTKYFDLNSTNRMCNISLRFVQEDIHVIDTKKGEISFSDIFEYIHQNVQSSKIKGNAWRDIPFLVIYKDGSKWKNDEIAEIKIKNGINHITLGSYGASFGESDLMNLKKFHDRKYLFRNYRVIGSDGDMGELQHVISNLEIRRASDLEDAFTNDILVDGRFKMTELQMSISLSKSKFWSDGSFQSAAKGLLDDLSEDYLLILCEPF